MYLGLGLLNLLLGGVWMVVGRERRTAAYRESMERSGGFSTLKRVLRRKEFFMLAAAGFGCSTMYSSMTLFLPTFLVEERNFTLTAAGFITALPAVGGLVSSITVGFLSDRVGLRRPTIWPAGALLPVLYFVLLSDISFIWAVATALLIGYVTWAPFPAIQSIPFELPGIAPSEVAVGQALIRTLQTGSNLMGPLIVGALAEGSGSLRTGLLVLAAYPFITAIMGLLLPETGHRRSQNAVQ
jgi:MFS family permease